MIDLSINLYTVLYLLATELNTFRIGIIGSFRSGLSIRQAIAGYLYYFDEAQ